MAILNLALDLHYLLTAYGQKVFQAEVLLGYAMQVLHETPVLTREAIRKALESPSPVGGGVLPPGMQKLAASELAEQAELIKIVPQPMSTDETSKLWTVFQTNYRPSVAYQVSVVLIESTHPARSPLPVLTRGRPLPPDPDLQGLAGRDEGVIVQPDLLPPFPTLQEVIPPNRQPAFRMGEVLAFGGHHLDGDDVLACFRHARSSRTLELPASTGATSTGFQVQIPDPAWINEITVDVIKNKRLLVVPGGSSPAIQVKFDNTSGTNAADNLLLTEDNGVSNRVATLSGEHVGSNGPHLDASDVKMSVDGGDTFVRVSVVPTDITLPARVPLATIAHQLQEAIREQAGADDDSAFEEVEVHVIDDRFLLVLSAEDIDQPVKFANFSETDQTAEKLFLTSEANTLKTTLSGEHVDDPIIPASPEVSVTIGGLTHTVALSFSPEVDLSNPVRLADIAPVLQADIRSVVYDDPAPNSVVADSSQNPDNWQAGVYGVTAVIHEPPERTTNELPVTLAPRVDSITRRATGDVVTLTVKCSPKVWKTQRVTLVVGDREIVAKPITLDKTDTLTFVYSSSGLPSGKQWVRLRVDSVESILVDRSGPLPTFADSQQVRISP